MIWEGIKFPPEKDDWKNNVTIALNVLYAKKDISKIYAKRYMLRYIQLKF